MPGAGGAGMSTNAGQNRSEHSDAASRPRYRTIVADPPWEVRQPPHKFGASGNAPLPYGTMSVEAIANLPVESLADDRAHLYLWTVNLFVRRAYEVVEAWGFRPVCLLTWCKQPMGQGPGYEYASTTEFVLFGRRGKADYPPSCRVERNWWVWKRGAHSVKPDAFLDLVEQVSPEPRLELFSRRARLGWDTWGDEALHGTSALERITARIEAGELVADKDMSDTDFLAPLLGDE